MDRNCKIFQDLLPAYIEKITSEETNIFMEEHLKNCEDCRKVYDEMTSDLEKETVKNVEIVKTIKKYKRKIKILKIFIILIILAIILTILGVIGFKFFVVKNALLKNIDNYATGNFRIEEYEESIDKEQNSTITYLGESKLKKVKGGKVLEYWEKNEHYFIDEDSKTYYIVNEEISKNDYLNIPILIIDGMDELIENRKVKNLEVLKFVLFKENLIVRIEPFRSKSYYVIKSSRFGNEIFLDKNTFFAERIVENGKSKEYRTLTSSVSWYQVTKPDLTGYTLVEK